MRALNIRIAYAEAINLSHHFPLEGDIKLMAVVRQAQNMGRLEWAVGNTTIPALFADTPLLAQNWLDGQTIAQLDYQERSKPSTDSELEVKMEKISDAANRGCGLYYELFEQRLYSAIDQWIAEANDHDKPRILSLAKAQFDYSRERPSGGWTYDQEANDLVWIDHGYTADHRS
jgi:hypothetical protein